MKKEFYTVDEIADIYNVTGMAVRHWINKGLPYEVEKVIGIKPRIVIKLEEVEEYLKLGIRKEE